jgi:hypothetical protein
MSFLRLFSGFRTGRAVPRFCGTGTGLRMIIVL